MKMNSWFIAAFCLSMPPGVSQARDTVHYLPFGSVVNIASNYKHQEHKDAERYECHASALMAGVALKGQLAEVK